MSKRTRLRMGVIAAALVVTMLCASCARRGDGETSTAAEGASDVPIVAVQKAKLGDLAHHLILTAEFTPYQEVDLMAKVAGYVKKINVDIGDRVHNGELLATLELPEMTDELAKASAQIQQSQAEVIRAQDDVERAKAAHDIAHISYLRLDNVAKTQPGLVAQQELDDAKSKDLVSEAQIAAAESNLAAAKNHEQVSLAEQSRLQTLFNYTRVTAPFTGVVTKRYANTGSMIQAGTASQSQAMPLVRLSQNDLLRLILPVPESAVPRIHLGEPVEVNVPSLQRTFPGKVARFADMVQISTRTMDTEVDVPNPSLVLIPGMYAEANLQLDTRDHVVTIPVAAVDNTNNATTVLRVNRDGVVEVVPVVLGLQTANNAEVRSGLRSGDMVIVGSRANLKAGQHVRPKEVGLYESKANS